MMSQMGMGPGGPNMRMPGPPVRNPGMQQIPPSGPMMRHQVSNFMFSPQSLNQGVRISSIKTILYFDFGMGIPPFIVCDTQEC